MFQDRKINNNRHCLPNRPAFPTKKPSFPKASIFKWYQFGEIFQQGWHDSSRGFFVGNFRPRFQGMGGAARWLQRGSCCGAKRALNAKPLRFFPNGGEEGRGRPPIFNGLEFRLNSSTFWEVLSDWFTRIMWVFLSSLGIIVWKNLVISIVFFWSFTPTQREDDPFDIDFTVWLETCQSSQQLVLMIGLWC